MPIRFSAARRSTGVSTAADAHFADRRAPPARALLISLLLALLVLVPPVHANPADEVRMSSAQQRAVGVETAAVQPARSGPLQALPAQVVVPNHQVRIVSVPLAALVDQVLVAPEQPVRKGQLLARLQSPALADAQHTYLQAVSRHELERANLERAEALFKAGVTPERQLLANRAEYNEVAIDLAERTQALRLAGMTDASLERLRGGRTVGTTIELVSPIDGVLIEQLAVVGQRLEASSALFRVARLDPLWLEIQVPVARLASVSTGATVRVLAAGAQGRVIAVGRNVSPSTQTALVRAEVSKGADRLRPGQFVEATLVSADSGGHWEVPNGAIARVGDRVLVFVRAAAGFRAVTVQVVGEGAARSVISAALRADDQVVVRGVASLKSAMLGIGVE